MQGAGRQDTSDMMGSRTPIYNHHISGRWGVEPPFHRMASSHNAVHRRFIPSYLLYRNITY